MATAAAAAPPARATPASWLARAIWPAVAIVLAFNAVQIFLAGHVASQFVHEQIGFVDFATLVLITVGAVVASKQPRNRIGWIIVAVGLLYTLESIGEGYFDHFARAGSWLPGARAVMWFSTWGWMPALGMLATFVLLLFPDGHLPSRRWWPLAAASAAVIVGTTAAGARDGWLLNEVRFSGRRPTTALVHLHLHLQLLVFLGQVLAGCCLVATVAAVVYRYRRATAEQRQQLKWGTYGSIGLAGTIGGVWIPMPGVWSWTLVDLGILWFAACVGVAILRYRLYDIDRVVNRTLVYAVLTALLVGVYAGLVIGLGSLVGRSHPLVIAGSTLAVAALIGPARRRVQAFVDRRFYRRKYDAAQTLEAFTARLRNEVDQDELREHLVQVVDRTMQPAHASLWLRSGEPAS
jgi:hypothetical protein